MRCNDDQDMTWHLHYDDLIRHKIFKLLISSYFFNIQFGLRSIQNNILIQNTMSHHRIFIKARCHFSQHHQIHMHITAQHHLSSHSIRSPKPKKTSSLNSQDSPTNSQLKNLSPCLFKVSSSPLWFSLATSDSQNFSFKSSSSLCQSPIFSLCC